MKALLNPRTQFAVGQSLYHLTLNTGHVARHDLEQLRRNAPLQLRPLLDPIFFLVPEMPSITLALDEQIGGARFLIHYRGIEVVQGSVVWDKAAGMPLWAQLREFYHRAVPPIPGWKNPCAIDQPPVPWVAVVLHENLIRFGREICAQVGGLERLLAWTLMHRALARN